MSKTYKIFIDGEAGTTGLQIRDRLANVDGVEVCSIADADRKNAAARKQMMESVDLAVLCLPDDAAREAVALADKLGDAAPRIIDASTAHRTAAGWVYGFPELLSGHAEVIQRARRVANPGCYATGAIALLRPLLVSGWFAPNHGFTINAVSGYTGGGKSMIANFESGKADAFHLYGLTLNHKHLPEIMAHSGLTQPPLFVPSVGNFAQGMLVSIPLQLTDVETSPSLPELGDLFSSYYGDANADNSVCRVIVHADEPATLSADAAQNDDSLHIYLFRNADHNQCLLVAQLDNLGKGAAGAAVQNIKLMLGLN